VIFAKSTPGERVSDVKVIVNRLAQGLLSADEGNSWFVARTASENRALLRELAVLILQARATTDDVPASIVRAGIKATTTPAVLASKGNLNDQLAKIGSLPEAEFLKAFRLLVALLGVADERRRDHDRIVGCSHWWHQLVRPRIESSTGH
jgi:hypothetical protein